VRTGSSREASAPYTVADEGGATRLTMAVEAEPRKLMARLTMSLSMSGYRKNMEKHLDVIEAHCEKPA
jgi:hypothetical protein